METQHKSDLFPFKCTPYMPVARDVIHRAVIEMALPKKKDIGIDERRSGWVQGITDVSTDNTERETIWFYRTYGNIRKWKRRTVEEVRFFFMKRTNTNELLCLPTSDIQRALEKLDWEVVRGLLLWCAAIYHGRWTAWEYPSWFLYKIWNLRIEKEKSFTFIHTLFKHLYVQIGDELYPCWDINEQTVLNNGSCKNIFGTWTQHMQERVHVSQRIGYGLIPWFNGLLPRFGYYAEGSYFISQQILDFLPILGIEPLFRYGALNVLEIPRHRGTPETWDRKMTTLALLAHIDNYLIMKIEYYLLDEKTGGAPPEDKVKDDQLVIQINFNF